MLGEEMYIFQTAGRPMTDHIYFGDHISKIDFSL